jgi:hypothetical protein
MSAKLATVSFRTESGVTEAARDELSRTASW